jgi:hypothetical protein
LARKILLAKLEASSPRGSCDKIHNLVSTLEFCSFFDFDLTTIVWQKVYCGRYGVEDVFTVAARKRAEL